MAFNPADHLKNLETKPNRPARMYLEVKYRMVWFREVYPVWGVVTKCIDFTDKRATFQATITDETGRPVAMAHATETPNDFPDFYEKAETKAVGRALALAGFGTQFTGSELDEGARIADSPVEAEAPWDGTGAPTVNQLYAVAKLKGMHLDPLLKAKGKSAAQLTDDERTTVGKWMLESGR